MKIVSDVIADFLEEQDIKVVFGIIGSANSYMFDSIAKKGFTEIVYVHHEQAAVMAAAAYFRVSGKISAALVTAGPGAINAMTGVVSNWADSIPVIILSGQESTKYMQQHKHLRMIGTQGFYAAEMVKDITKYSKAVMNEQDVLYEMQKALDTAISGRPGPVWLDIPFDIQSKPVDVENLRKLEPVTAAAEDLKINDLVSLIQASKRPLILGGHGIKLSNSKQQFRQLVKKMQIPTLLTWSSIDVLPEDEPCYFGRSGIYGQRRANFVVQNCDLLVVLGSRLALPQTGYNIENYAPNAKIVMVNNDPNELEKHARYDLKIYANVKDVITSLLEADVEVPNISEWMQYCTNCKANYPTAEKHHKDTEYDNSYVFFDEVSDLLQDDHIIVAGMGTAMASSHQAIKIKKDQTMFTSNGLGEMGWGLPSLVGASFASQDRPLLCLMSDGSMMMNLQELQTIINYKIPVKIVIFNNDGYLFIKHTQKMLFKGNFVGVDQKTGIEMPQFKKIADAFGFKYFNNNNNSLQEFLDSDEASFYEFFMDPEQPLTPKVKGILTKDGIVAPPIEEMSPLLDIEKVKETMLIGLNPLSNKIRDL